MHYAQLTSYCIGHTGGMSNMGCQVQGLTEEGWVGRCCTPCVVLPKGVESSVLWRTSQAFEVVQVSHSLRGMCDAKCLKWLRDLSCLPESRHSRLGGRWFCHFAVPDASWCHRSCQALHGNSLRQPPRAEGACETPVITCVVQHARQRRSRATVACRPSMCSCLCVALDKLL